MIKTFRIIGIISIILNLFGCSGQLKKDDGKLSKETDQHHNKSSETLKNRPIYMELTEQIIDTTSDNNLLQLVFDNLAEKQPSDYKKVYEIVMSWNKARQAFYMIYILKIEVDNGGYNQFYYNSGGQFFEDLPDALKLVGAQKFADLTKRANDILEKEYPKITQHQDGSLEGFFKSYDDNPLRKFDDEFYDLDKTDNLEQILVGFIRKHKAEFADK